MPVKTRAEVEARPEIIDVEITNSGGETSIDVRGASVNDPGDPLVRLLTETRTGLAPGATAAVWPEADVPYATVVRAYAACLEARVRARGLPNVQAVTKVWGSSSPICVAQGRCGSGPRDLSATPIIPHTSNCPPNRRRYNAEP